MNDEQKGKLLKAKATSVDDLAIGVFDTDEFVQTLKQFVSSLDASIAKAIEQHGDKSVAIAQEVKEIAAAIERQVANDTSQEIKGEVLQARDEVLAKLGNLHIPDQVTIKNQADVSSLATDKTLVEVKSALLDLANEINNKAVNQDPTEFVPYRRVIKEGNRFVFDDSRATSVGGGEGTDNSILSSINQRLTNGTQVAQIRAADSPSIDSFSRWRVSEPNYIFDTNFQYDLQPLVFEAVTAQTGATVTHDATNRNALMTFSSTPTGGSAYMQTYEWFRYQAGRSQLILLTFNFIENVANTKKFVGYGDGNNGIQLELNGTTAQVTLYSDTAKGDETVTQANWNLDKLDGTGASGLTVDWTKTQIFVLDFQWLGVGRVRCGLDIDGLVYYFHQFDHANHQEVAYMQTANLPIRAGMTCTGTVSTTMRFICASVTTEGGETDVGGYNFSQEGTVTASSGARTHILSLRPNTTFNSIANRSKFVLESVEVLVTGNQPVLWELVLGQAISGTTSFTDVNATYSGMEYNTAGTISGSPALVIAQGYVASAAANKGNVGRTIANKYPIALNQAGAVHANGTLSVIVTGIGGTSATRVSLNWREIR